MHPYWVKEGLQLHALHVCSARDVWHSRHTSVLLIQQCHHQWFPQLSLPGGAHMIVKSLPGGAHMIVKSLSTHRLIANSQTDRESPTAPCSSPAACTPLLADQAPGLSVMHQRKTTQMPLPTCMMHSHTVLATNGSSHYSSLLPQLQPPMPLSWPMFSPLMQSSCVAATMTESSYKACAGWLAGCSCALSSTVHAEALIPAPPVQAALVNWACSR
jgi:hypothetical protein